MQSATAENLTHNSHNGAEVGPMPDSVDCVHGLGRVEKLMRELSDLGVVLSVEGGRLAFDAPADVMTEDLLGRMRADRAGLLALLNPSSGPAGHRPNVTPSVSPLLALLNPSPGDAAVAVPEADPGVVAIVEAFEELSPEDVPACDTCGRYCDVETLAGRWCCSRCDPAAEARRLRTERLMARAAAMNKTEPTP